MSQSVLGGSIAFMAKLGVYDVVLPFLLIFTLVFAFLEKSKVLGVEIVHYNGKDYTYTRKNLNSVVAFTIGFFVIASAQLVRIISEIVANTMIIVVMGVSFMLAVGITHTGQEEFKLEKGWKTGFFIISAIGILLITLNALGWLAAVYDFLVKNWQNAHIATTLMILVFVGFMAWVTGGFDKKASGAPKKEKTDG